MTTRARALAVLGFVVFLAMLGTSAIRGDAPSAAAQPAGAAPPMSAPGDAPMGPLRPHPTNRRYFADPAGRAVYLTGSHTWANFQDRGPTDPPPAFDFPAYLDFLQAHRHNFIRLWAWEHAQWAPWTRERIAFAPLAYRRTGAGTARDGRPRFDLTAFDEGYFARLRQRVAAARQRRIYVSVMLFQGWSIDRKGRAGNPWPGHPFHPDNNVNGVNGDRNGNGEGRETHMLAVPAIQALQRAYIRRVVDALNDLDNVLWEVSNESHRDSTAWQYDVIRFVKAYEATLAFQHPIGMTAQFPRGRNNVLFESPADWISPVHEPGAAYRTDPPPGTEDKVVVSDTDHLWGVGGDGVWVWKTFTRGLHPIYMDPYGDASRADERAMHSARRAMGQTLDWARRLDLGAMTPRPDLSSSRYCLANPGQEYLVYSPAASWIAVSVSGVDAEFTVEWFSPASGHLVPGGTVHGGGSRTFTPPFPGDAVLYLRRRAQRG